MGSPRQDRAGSETAAVTRQVAATWCDFYFFFKKKWLLPGGIFIFFPPILKLEVGFFSDKKSFSHNG